MLLFLFRFSNDLSRVGRIALCAVALLVSSSLVSFAEGFRDPKLASLLSKDPSIFSDTRPIAIVRDDPGGYKTKRERHMEQVRQRGQKIAIVGTCASSCTFYLGLGRQVCVAPTALLGFHGPSRLGEDGVFRSIQGERRARLVRDMASHYPGPIRRWFVQKAAHLSDYDVAWVSGKDIIAQGVASCDDWGVR